jgi:hypothetical protein
MDLRHQRQTDIVRSQLTQQIKNKLLAEGALEQVVTQDVLWSDLENILLRVQQR